jgi:DNA polymerase-3 subunit beta
VKATVNKADLLRAASTAERAVNTKSSLPILSTLLLKIEEGRLHLAATDLEIGLKTVVEVTDYEEGSVAVPAGLFADVIKAAPAATLTLEVTDTHLIVKGGKSRYKVPVFGDASEFPVLPEVANLGQIVVKESVLREALERITVACAAEDTRPILMAPSGRWRRAARP